MACTSLCVQFNRFYHNYKLVHWLKSGWLTNMPYSLNTKALSSESVLRQVKSILKAKLKG